MEGEVELLRVGVFGLRRKWRPQHAVLKGNTLHLCRVAATPEHQKTLSMAGSAINRKDISRPADAWRNLFVLVLPPLADRSRGVKKYTLSAATAELQAAWMSALTTASQSPVARQIAAYSKGVRLSRSLSRMAAAAFRPLQLGIGALSPADRHASQELPAESEQERDMNANSVQCWALPAATCTQQFALPTAESCEQAHSTDAEDGPPATPAAGKVSDPPLMPHAAPPAPEPKDAGNTAAPDDAHGTTCQSDSATAPVTNQDTYPQLVAGAKHVRAGSLLIKADGSAQHARTL